jgi:protein-S-isoprenylcysteine O-methyltransferase Ste14
VLPLILTNPGAAAIFVLACLIWNVPEGIGMFTQQAGASRAAARARDQGSLVALIGLQWLGLVLAVLLGVSMPGAAIRWQRTALFGLGMGLLLLGVAVRWYAIWVLGRYFTREVAVSVDQPVVRCGPYRWIRHPAYSGTFLTMLGVWLALANWASLVVLVICVGLGHFYRVCVEERALTQVIGQPYIEYMRRTKRFIPWLW